jgi:hypothetical protein
VDLKHVGLRGCTGLIRLYKESSDYNETSGSMNQSVSSLHRVVDHPDRFTVVFCRSDLLQGFMCVCAQVSCSVVSN